MERRYSAKGEKGEEEEVLPVYVGHSAGGGLGQYLLSEGLLKAGGLVLCAAVPGQGR